MSDESTIRFENVAKGKTYQLNDRIATLMVRPRGWHLVEKHVHVDGQPVDVAKIPGWEGVDDRLKNAPWLPGSCVVESQHRGDHDFKERFRKES